MGGTVSHYAESSGHAGQGGRGGEKHQNAVEKVMIYDEQKSSEGEGITEYNSRMDEEEERKKETEGTAGIAGTAGVSEPGVAEVSGLGVERPALGETGGTAGVAAVSGLGVGRPADRKSVV